MTPEELKQTLKAAKKLVEKMPMWKRTFLVLSAEPQNSKPRMPVRNGCADCVLPPLEKKDDQ